MNNHLLLDISLLTSSQIVLSLCLGSISYGYDFSVISTTVGQPSWYAYMGLTADPTQAALYAYSNQIIGTVFGLFSAGAIFGALFVGWVCDAYGRQKSLILAAIINLLGAGLQTGSVHIGMFIAARFVTGFSAGKSSNFEEQPKQHLMLTYLAMFVTMVPVYIAEVAPPATRGLLVGQHGTFGSIV